LPEAAKRDPPVASPEPMERPAGRADLLFHAHPRQPSASNMPTAPLPINEINNNLLKFNKKLLKNACGGIIIAS